MRKPVLPALCLIIILLTLSSITLQSVVYGADEKSWAIQTGDDFKECLDGTFNDNEVCGQAFAGMYIPAVSVFGLNCILTGEPCSKDPTRQELFEESSLLRTTGNFVASLYTVPNAHTSAWIADVGTKMGVISPAYAQGIGFSALSPVLDLWKMSRNIAYGLIIVMLLVVGIMIMMRTKIDARTAISIQAALPRIIVALIIITFSYPIAGFMVDVMYVLLFFGLAQIAPHAGLEKLGFTPADLQAQFAGGGGLWTAFMGIVRPRTWLVTGASLGIGILSIFALPGVAGALMGKVGTTVAGGLGLAGKVSPVVGGLGIATGLLGLFLAITMLFAFLRIYFMLLQAYINLLISVIFAPILLLGEVLPGQNQFQFSAWLKNIMANLVVFPATAILIVMASVIVRKFSGEGAAGIGALFTGEQNSVDLIWSPPLLGFGAQETIEILIPLGFALAIPTLVGTIKKMFGAKPILSVGGAVGRAFGQPIGVVQQGLGTLTQIRMLQHR